jgi:phosphoribosylformylglycinamidine cyclo-ligase
MLRTFNCGIGMVLVVAPDSVAAVTEVLTRHGETVTRIGEIAMRKTSAVVLTGKLNLDG